MSNAKSKIPGKIWRVLSFIPVINWISLFYIGVTNASAMRIVCSMAYCVLTFAYPSAAPALWIVGMLHYAVAYRIVKRHKEPSMTKTDPLPPVQQEAPQSQRVFSDVTVSGALEQRQAVPVRPVVDVGQVQVSFSVGNPQGKFFGDMQKYASLEGRPAAFVPFMTYWPTYDSMSKQQRAWYFYWRSLVRKGSHPDTDLSYIFVMIYELLSGVGWQTPQEGYDMLTRLWSAYRDRFPKLDSYLSAWTFDFAQLHHLPYTFPVDRGVARLNPSTMTDIMVEQHAEDVPLKLPFALIDALCDYSLVNSKFYKEGNQALMEEAIPRVVALADAALRKKTQKGILATYGPNRPKKQEHYAFASAVCPQANQKIALTIKAYSTNQRLRGYVNELVRYGENKLRELRGCRGRLRGIALDEETSKLVDAFLRKEYGQPASAVPEAASQPGVALDFQSIDALRHQSDAVRSALQVEEADEHIEKALLTDVREVTAIYVALSNDAHRFLDRLEQADWACAWSEQDESSIAEINRLAEHYLGCALLVREEDIVMAEDDYRDELAYIYENPPEISESNHVSVLFDLTVLPAELGGFVEQLAPEQRRALHALVTCDHPQSELERIAEKAMTMPQMLLDDINGAAMQTLGDLLVDSMDEEPRVMEEYLASLKQSAA